MIYLPVRKTIIFCDEPEEPFLIDEIFSNLIRRKRYGFTKELLFKDGLMNLLIIDRIVINGPWDK